MTTKEKIKLVETAFSALYPLENITWTNYPQELFRMCLDEEKSHRGEDFNRSHPNTYLLTLRPKCLPLNG